MRAVGIVAEYNPLHQGHIYHIRRSAEVSGSDAVIAAMSGDFVQRGEPAIFDKWIRTGAALNAGADLVIEIPALFVLAHAGTYAGAAVRLLESTGKVSHISFGSECGDAERIMSVSSFIKDNKPLIETRTRELASSGLSYPAARERAYAEIRGTDKADQELELLHSPNDILGIEYIMAMTSAKPVAIKRAGTGYGDMYKPGAEYQSASAIRKMILYGNGLSESDRCSDSIRRYVPDFIYKAALEEHITGIDRDKWFDMLRFAIMSYVSEETEDCPSAGEGLANLMKKEIMTARSFDDFILKVKSRRYTYTRISRLAMQILLGITRDKYRITDPGYIRVLGFNDKGRELLSEMRRTGSPELPVITNIGKQRSDLGEDARKLLDLDIHASDIYNLMTGRDVAAMSDHRKGPVIMQNHSS